MAKITQPEEYTYEGWAKVLGLKESKRIGHNTDLVRLPDGGIGIRLHWTVVVTYERDGSIRLNSGGFETTTTKQRINACLPAGFRVFAKSYKWYVQIGGFENGETIDFRDMMIVRHATKENA